MDYDHYIHNNNKEIELFVDALEDTIELPKEIKNYPILNPPLNEMIGGLSKKKTSHRAKALDNESKNAELEHKTEVMNSLILEKARMEILLKMKQSGKLQEAQNTDDPEQVKRIKQEFQERLEEKIEGQIMNYTSMAEKWANHTISALSTEFGIKELASEALSDLLISSRI